MDLLGPSELLRAPTRRAGRLLVVPIRSRTRWPSGRDSAKGAGSPGGASSAPSHRGTELHLTRVHTLRPAGRGTRWAASPKRCRARPSGTCAASAHVVSRFQLGDTPPAQIWGYPGTARPGRRLTACARSGAPSGTSVAALVRTGEQPAKGGSDVGSFVVTRYGHLQRDG
jgi:hypothetical protein